jgi:hypothetical protein
VEHKTNALNQAHRWQAASQRKKLPSYAGQMEARENRDGSDPNRWSLVSVPIG